MSSYVFGGRISYNDYLAAKGSGDDGTPPGQGGGERILVEISRKTRDVIASGETLAAENIQVLEPSEVYNSGSLPEGMQAISSAIEEGFSLLSYDLQNISSGLSELNATFHWGFGQMLAGMNRINHALSELIKIARTPAQTAAYEQGEIARDAFRQGLYAECLEALDKAINGDHISPGYKLEWRFHYMKGVLHLGFAGGDMSLVDLPKAEESFLLAARYAKADSPEQAAQAFLSAGWAAYCLGHMEEALIHTGRAAAMNPHMGEAFFQAAKVRMSMGEVESALPLLGEAIDLNRFYALKAAGDGDFQKYDDRLRGFLDLVRRRKYDQSVPAVRTVVDKIGFWREHSMEARIDEDARRMDAFLAEGENWPLLDTLNAVQKLENTISGLENKAKKAIIVLNSRGSAHPSEETYKVEEACRERVVTKPTGLIGNGDTETHTITRTLKETRVITRTVDGIRDDICNGFGERLCGIEFCSIPAGAFPKGYEKKGRVTVSRDFLLGKYPVTQAQWAAVMGTNPSRFKGADRPVENVSRYDCLEFINILNRRSAEKVYRLPSEAEWEYAFMTGSDDCYCCDLGRMGEFAWYDGNLGRETYPVGRDKPNAWGLFDMRNVWEWCDDWYDDNPSMPEIDPAALSGCTAAEMNRNGNRHLYIKYVRASFRFYHSPDDRKAYLGFRLARNP